MGRLGNFVSGLAGAVVGGLVVLSGQYGISYSNSMKNVPAQKVERTSLNNNAPYFLSEFGTTEGKHFIRFYDNQSAKDMHVLYKSLNTDGTVEYDLKFRGLASDESETLFELPQMPERSSCQVYAIDRDGNKSDKTTLAYENGRWRTE